MNPGECLFLSLADLLCPSHTPFRRIRTSHVQFFELPSYSLGIWREPLQLAEGPPSSLVDEQYCLSIFNQTVANPDPALLSNLTSSHQTVLVLLPADNKVCAGRPADSRMEVQDRQENHSTNGAAEGSLQTNTYKGLTENAIAKLVEQVRANDWQQQSVLLLMTSLSGCADLTAIMSAAASTTDILLSIAKEATDSKSISKKRRRENCNENQVSGDADGSHDSIYPSSSTKLSEFFDSNIQSLLANPPSGQRHASFIPVFKFLRSYGWYYDD
ncbi:hypothetical protein EON65_31410, partial [archaeon]